MCGPGNDQKTLASQQAAFATTLQQSFGQRFAGQDAVLSKLNAALTPIVAAGPSQQGFNPAELNNLNARAIDDTSANYANAARSLNGQLAGRGGDIGAGGGNDSGLQSGVDSQIKASLASEGARVLSGQEHDINIANYETGRQNYNQALAGMNALSGQYDPSQFGNLAGGNLQNAFNSAKSIDQQKGAFWKTLGGVVSGVGSQVLNHFLPPAPKSFSRSGDDQVSS